MPRIDLFYYGDTSPGQTPGGLYRDIEEQVVLGDRLGYSGVWITEHHLHWRGEVPDPLLFLGYLAGRTERIRLGTSIVCAPFYNPVKLAESAFLLDELSGGRLDLGIGTGIGDERLDEAFGIDRASASDRAREIFEILRQAADEEEIDFVGRYYRVQGVRIAPPARRSAKDLLWVAASRYSTELAAAHGYRLMIPRPLPLDERLRFNREYREVTGDAGEVVHLRSGLVGRTRDEARRDAVEFLREYAKVYLRLDWRGGPDSQQFDELADQLSFAIGTAPEVADRIRAWTEQFGGTEVTAIQFQGPGVAHQAALRAIELFAEELPALQADAPVPGAYTAKERSLVP
ncbi:LLM class flavin-dependent oxidoreductase [Microbacterium sp.]|uniref:LLM class flavin-dependent oxidoreductase n=1 Tax=Microbacterium sp. TaxID=51671 RepID=UPI0039E4BCE4